MFFDGNDNPVSKEYVFEEFDNYVPFAEAARMIDRGWTTNYLHKQKAIGRLDRTKILYVIDEGMKKRMPSTKGKKMFLHKTEIERFKRDVYPTIKKQKRGHWENFCTWCRAKIEICHAKPCYDRMHYLIIERARKTGDKEELRQLSAKTVLSIRMKEVTKNGRRKK